MSSGLRLSIRVAVCVSGLLWWAGTAAADGYVVPKAVVVAPVPTWTGCYGGLDSGYKWGQTRLTTPTPSTLNNPAPFPPGIGAVRSALCPCHHHPRHRISEYQWSRARRTGGLQLSGHTGPRDWH